MKKRFTEEQISKVLQEEATGSKIEELCRKYGVTLATAKESQNLTAGMFQMLYPSASLIWKRVSVSE